MTPPKRRAPAHPIQPKPKCKATNKKTGEPCGNYPLRGSEVCRYHGGRAPQIRRKAEQRVAIAEVEKAALRLGGSLDVHPIDVLLGAVKEAAANVAAYRMAIEGLGIELAEDGAVPSGSVAIPSRDLWHDRGVVHVEAKLHILVVAYNDERDRLVKYAKLCIDAGVAEKLVQLKQAEGRGLAEVVRAAVEATNPTDAERAAALQAAGAAMRRLGAGLG